MKTWKTGLATVIAALLLCASIGVGIARVVEAYGEKADIDSDIVRSHGPNDIKSFTFIEPNDPNRVEFIDPNYMSGWTSPAPRKPKSTHTCPVHGELGGEVWCDDFLTIQIEKEEIYRCCVKCAMRYVARHLKENIPQLTKFEKETK